MAEYIERQEAIEAVKHAWAKGLEPSQYIEIIPAADVAPVRRGRWIHYKGKSNLWYCSECGEKIIYNQNKVIYNPNRGTYIVDKKPVYKVNKRCRTAAQRCTRTNKQFQYFIT